MFSRIQQALCGRLVLARLFTLVEPACSIDSQAVTVLYSVRPIRKAPLKAHLSRPILMLVCRFLMCSQKILRAPPRAHLTPNDTAEI